MDKLLIANRGEIAVRIARTCKELGIRTVAVHSSADEDALHVRVCDEAVCIGSPAPSESYLRGEVLLEAAVRSGADGVHPGYGFLSENSGFAQMVIDAGLTWVGPPPKAIAVMGSKSRARDLAVELGVPVLPGSTEPTLEAARSIGFPLLVKAVSGGGGRGMRIVREEAGFEEACDAASREAQSAFGDGALMLERYLERPRHVEIQVFGDQHGGHVHLYERECSIQRRHQKVVEEHPSTVLDETLREEMGAAAVRLSKAMNYVGAGTVEFLVGPDGGFYFLEMNTRLQVEHPVTEAIAGVDLVAWQLAIAEGAPLPEVGPRRGAAIEVRVYAEDPDAGYAPRTGVVLDFHQGRHPGVRIDSGVATGSDVSVHYDPMLAKVIAEGDDRDQARRRLIRALEDLSLLGVGTNIDHLLRILRHPAYAAGELHTGFLEDHAQDLSPGDDQERVRWAMLGCAARMLAEPRALLPGIPKGWRNSRWRDPSLYLGGVELTWRGSGDGWLMALDGTSYQVQLVSQEGPAMRLSVDGLTRQMRVVEAEGAWFVHVLRGSVSVSRDDPWPAPQEEVAPGACKAPMPGKVLTVAVETGQSVAEGDLMAVLEAMKTEHRLLAPRDGIVSVVRVQPGDQVDAGTVLVALQEE